jgi:hypothetical protein
MPKPRTFDGCAKEDKTFSCAPSLPNIAILVVPFRSSFWLADLHIDKENLM